MKLLASLFTLVTLTASAYGENWAQWRGPYFNGSTTEQNLPVNWTQQDNIVWSVDMPGPSAATPIVWENHVFVSSADTKKGTCQALCFDRRNGERLWQHDVSEGISRDRRSYFSAPSPATDGKIVVFFYGNGELAAYNFDGDRQWARNLGPFAFQWTFSTSPLLHDGKLYMQILQRNQPVRGVAGSHNNESFLLCLDSASGKTLWRHVRPSPAYMESLEAFTTPVPFSHAGRTELLIAGGDVLTGHDPDTGEELWRWGTWNPTRIGHWRLVPSPVAGDDVILVCAPKGSPIYAVKAGGKGDLSDDSLVWSSDRRRHVSSDVPTPAYYDGDFFVLNKKRTSLSRVDPKTGAAKWTNDELGSQPFEASPTAADGKVYIIDFDGVVSVIDAATGDRLSQIPMEPEQAEDFVRSSVVVSQGQLFIRTNSKLYCVGK